MASVTRRGSLESVLAHAKSQKPEEDEAALIQAARTNPKAFGPLYQSYLARVYRYLRTRTPTEEAAADLTQQVFLKALAALPSYHPRGLPFSAWLFRIARNAVIDRSRRSRDTLSLENLHSSLEPRAEVNPEATFLNQEQLERLCTLLGRLDSDKRELLALRFAAQLTSGEIGLIVGKSEAAVKKQLQRTLHALKEAFREE